MNACKGFCSFSSLRGSATALVNGRVVFFQPSSKVNPEVFRNYVRVLFSLDVRQMGADG